MKKIYFVKEAPSGADNSVFMTTYLQGTMAMHWDLVTTYQIAGKLFFVFLVPVEQADEK